VLLFGLLLQMRPGPLDEKYCAVVLRELLLALEYIHGENKLHRDIKGIHTANAHCPSASLCDSLDAIVH
jgi:protein-serine/threonine kinase